MGFFLGILSDLLGASKTPNCQVSGSDRYYNWQDRIKSLVGYRVPSSLLLNEIPLISSCFSSPSLYSPWLSSSSSTARHRCESYFYLFIYFTLRSARHRNSCRGSSRIYRTCSPIYTWKGFAKSQLFPMTKHLISPTRKNYDNNRKNIQKIR